MFNIITYDYDNLVTIKLLSIYFLTIPFYNFIYCREECKPPIPVSHINIGPIYKKDVMRANIMNEKVMSSQCSSQCSIYFTI